MHIKNKPALATASVPRAPLIDYLNEDIEARTREVLDGFLGVFHMRRVMAGYVEGESPTFDSHVLSASGRFQAMWTSLFPEASADVWVDLDGLQWDAAIRTAGPRYYMHKMQLGFRMIAEGLAIMEDLSSGLAQEPGHPYLSGVSDSTASTYRAMVLLLMDEISRAPDRMLWPSDPEAARESLTNTLVALGELALNPAIFPSQIHLWTRRPSWTDIHPGWRYANLCYAIHRIGPAPGKPWADAASQADLIGYLDTAAERLGWPPHSKVVEALSGSLADDLRTSPLSALFDGVGNSTLIAAKQRSLGFLLGAHDESVRYRIALEPDAVVLALGAKDQDELFAPFLCSLVEDLYFYGDFARTGDLARVALEPDYATRLVTDCADLLGCPWLAGVLLREGS